jgi:hypothetical protein
MNYPDGSQAVRLALLGSIKEEVLPNDDLARALLAYLRECYPYPLQNRYGIANPRRVSMSIWSFKRNRRETGLSAPRRRPFAR